MLFNNKEKESIRVQKPELVGIMPEKNIKESEDIMLKRFILIWSCMSVMFLGTICWSPASAETSCVGCNDGSDDCLNCQRLSDIESIFSAIQQYAINNNGAIPPGITNYERMIGTAGGGCELSFGQCTDPGTTSCLNLASPLAPYLATIPNDPQSGNSSQTNYAIKIDGSNIITVTACRSNDPTIASISRVYNDFTSPTKSCLSSQFVSSVLFSDSIQSIVGGTPVQLPDFVTPSLSTGLHFVSLIVGDHVNSDVAQTFPVLVYDDIAPILAPLADRTILWPVNKKMTAVMINAHASDNSGAPVILSVSIACNEAVSGAWTNPVIDQSTGIITFQLLADSSNKGSGRTYTIHITATDTSGNSSVADVNVIVAHEKVKK